MPASRTVADRLARLSPDQRAALQRRMKARGDRPEPGPDLVRRPDAERALAPLGLDQERIWVIDQLDPGRHTYNISTGMRFKGAFDEEAFHRAVEALVRRHELLRSSVEVHDGAPRLRTHQDFEVPLTFVDLRAEPERLAETLRTLVRRPFDPAAGGLLRVVAVRVADDDYHVVETMHHSITDQWSFVRLNRELLTHYRAACEGRASELPELPVQFGDFAAWQREVFTGEHQERERAFWRTYLDGAPGHLPLPYDGAPADAGHAGRHHYFLLDADLAARFLAACRQWRVTLSDALLAVYAALLHEETGAHDIVVGLPSATRSRPETHDLIGFLLTNVPIRVRLPQHPTPEQFLTAVRSASAAVADHREVPFSEIVEAVQPERSLDRYPLLQTMHLVLDFEETVVRLPEAEVVGIEVEDGVSPMDLTVGWWRAGERLYGRIEYRTELFSDATVSRLVTRLLDLVRVFCEHPQDPLTVRATADPGTGTADAGPAEPDPADVGPADADPAVVARIAAVWHEVLGTEPGQDQDQLLHPDANFFRCGGTSLKAIQLAHALRAAGFALGARQVFLAPTVRGQAALARRTDEEAAATLAAPDEGAVSPQQEDLLEGGLPRPELWTHSVVLTAGSRLDPQWLKVAVKRVVAAHPALCSAFRREEERWRRQPSAGWLWRTEDTGAAPEAVAAGHREAFDLAGGPLFAASLIPGAPEIPGTPDLLVLTAHHLVVDGLSWQILVEDLERAYRGLRPVAEACHPSAYAAVARSVDVRGQLAHWERQLKDRPALGCRTGGANLLGGETEHRVTVELPAHDPAVDRSLQALTAVALAARPWFDGGDVVLDLIGPGRDLPAASGWDPLRAVGFHAAVHPLRIPHLDPGDDPAGQVARLLEAVPDGGVGHLAARWSEDAAVRSAAAELPRAELAFNYLGALLDEGHNRHDGHDALFTVSDQLGPAGNEEADRYHLVDVVFAHDGERGVFTWKYHPQAVDEEKVRAVAERAGTEFDHLVRRVRPPGAEGAATVGMSLAEVNTMLADLTHDRTTGDSR